MNKHDIKYIIKKILIYSGVALILMFVKSCDIKALSFSNGVTYNRTIQVYNGNLKGSVGLFTSNTFHAIGGNFNSNKTITCDTEYCGFEMYYSAGLWYSADSNINITASQEIVTTNAQMLPNYEMCSVNGGSISCMVKNNTTISGISIHFTIGYSTYTQTNKETFKIDYNVVDQMNIYNIIDIGTVQQEINNNVNDIKNSINNDNVDDQQSSDFFNNFGSTTNQGLQDLIKKPIDIVDSFYNSCSPITFNIPYFNTTITLPCISSIQNDFTSVIFPIIRVIINGILCYRILTRFIDEINKLKDPNNSDLEVVDL